MPTQLQFRRGTTAQTASFTGALAEVTVDTNKNVIVVHDGTTAGGWPAPALSYVQSSFDKANTDTTNINIASGTFGNNTTIPSVTVAANGRVTAISATSFTAGASIADETSSASTFYPLFANQTSGTPTSIFVSSTKLSYVPSTGTITAVDLNTTSDAKYKENVEHVSSALNIIGDIQGVSFNWKETGSKSYGIIAQELQKILPELVHSTERGLSVSYLPLIAILIEAVKEQQKQIDELKK